MKTALVGCTGFVGSNLAGAYDFSALYHSVDVESAYGTKPDLLVYAGVRAEKFLANRAPEEDMKNIKAAFSNIEKIAPKKLVLISTIDVYPVPVGVDEDTPVAAQGAGAYGGNRRQLEIWVRDAYPDALILRLPGLYGKGIKKNFIYDYIHVIPAMLKEELFREFQEKEARLNGYYQKLDNGFYKCRSLNKEERREARACFERLGFSAARFTDSRGIFQFYPLSRLWSHLSSALEMELRLLNLATEPVQTAEVYRCLSGKEFVNHVAAAPPHYDYRSKYAERFGGKNGYLLSKEDVLADLKAFVEGEQAGLY